MMQPKLSTILVNGQKVYCVQIFVMAVSAVLGFNSQQSKEHSLPISEAKEQFPVVT